MEDYQKRVIEEAESLDAKIKKLDAFIETPFFRDLGCREDQELLLSQRHAMLNYYIILQRRIARFETEPLLSRDEALMARKVLRNHGINVFLPTPRDEKIK